MSSDPSFGAFIVVVLLGYAVVRGLWTVLRSAGKRCPSCTGGKKWISPTRFVWCERCNRTGFIVRKP